MRKPYDPQFTPDAATMEALADFIALVYQLRRDCPWDRVQTPDTVKHLLIEEAYEALEAIDQADWDGLKKELGDLLLHVVFHSVMAVQDGRFALRGVVEAESAKLIRRHPHVFGDTAVSGVQDVLANWEQIKQQEGGRQSVLGGVPAALPALLRAHRVQEKAAAVGFDFPHREDTWAKVVEEIGEFRALVEAGASPAAKEREFGDLLFALVNYARFVDVNPENALRATNDRFIRRFQHIERRLAEQGWAFSDVDLATMDGYWEEAKALEQGAPV
jgi:XTP/dITP diphosphohydrolase/tetrapyrrole methylase family protein/MazG family protein